MANMLPPLVQSVGGVNSRVVLPLPVAVYNNDIRDANYLDRQLFLPRVPRKQRGGNAIVQHNHLMIDG